VLVLRRDAVALRGAARGAGVAVSYSYSYPDADSHPDADAVYLDVEPAPGAVACRLGLVVFPVRLFFSVRLVVLVRPRRGPLTGVARVPC
jgi:hypothetical protein